MIENLPQLLLLLNLFGFVKIKKLWYQEFQIYRFQKRHKISAQTYWQFLFDRLYKIQERPKLNAPTWVYIFYSEGNALMKTYFLFERLFRFFLYKNTINYIHLQLWQMDNSLQFMKNYVGLKILSNLQ